MSYQDYEWGREQARNGQWHDGMNSAQSDGYYWQKWLDENEARQRAEADARLAAQSRAASEASWGSGSGDASFSYGGGGVGGSGGGGGGGDGLASLAWIGGFFGLVLILEYWKVILVTLGIAGVIGLIGWGLSRIPRATYVKAARAVLHAARIGARVSTRLAVSAAVSAARWIGTATARTRRQALARMRGRPLPPPERI